jgi:hypothetical protein
VLVGIAPPAAARVHRHRRPILVAASYCSGRYRRPKTIVIDCGNGTFYASHLRYSRYGHRRAEATGKLFYSSCFPDCPSVQFNSYRGSITLSHIGFCHGRRYYERIAWRFDGRRPFPNGAATLRPVACRPL